ncbi:MAG: hypothetical protein FJ009_00495 [Chloroflexi bacterium]|nr:hypothetical protein [Chloroflexota bacterium]
MSILIFLVVFALTIFLQRWLHQHIQGFALALTGKPGCGLRLLFYLLLPGVILHELSHYIVAKVLLVRTGNVHIGLGNPRARRVTLGSVNIERTDPFRESLIGAAPFVFGVGAIWLIAAWGFDVWPQAGASWELFFQRVAQYADDWTTWLDLYLIFAVSTAMIPSESDRAPWGPVFTVFGALVAFLFVLGWTPNIPPAAMTLARNWLDALTFALGLAVIVNGVIAVALWILEVTLRQISGKRVDYRVRRR